MKQMQLREAKAHLSEVVELAQSGEATTITKHGNPVAMVVPLEEGRKLYPQNKKRIVDVLMEYPGDDLDLERDRTPIREIDL